MISKSIGRSISLTYNTAHPHCTCTHCTYAPNRRPGRGRGVPLAVRPTHVGAVGREASLEKGERHEAEAPVLFGCGVSILFVESC